MPSMISMMNKRRGRTGRVSKVNHHHGILWEKKQWRVLVAVVPGTTIHLVVKLQMNRQFHPTVKTLQGKAFYLPSLDHHPIPTIMVTIQWIPTIQRNKTLIYLLPFFQRHLFSLSFIPSFNNRTARLQ